MGRKARNPIAANDVPRVFDEACIERLACIGRLPTHADKAKFAAGVREAARIFARDACSPNVNELHNEIDGLYWAAEQRRYEEVRQRIERLSKPSLYLLTKRGELPAFDSLRDPAQHDRACAVVERLCAVGGRNASRSDRRGTVWRPLLNAPDKQRNFPRRDAERNLVMWLQIAWLEATGVRAPQTARHADAGRSLGSFARIAQECLRLVGAADADVVELINELRRRRRHAATCLDHPLTFSRRGRRYMSPSVTHWNEAHVPTAAR